MLIHLASENGNVSFRCLAKLISRKANDWDEYLEAVLFGIHTSIQESTKYTPFFLMHGKEARLPLEVDKSRPTEDFDITSTIARLEKVREQIFPIAKKNIELSQEKQKEQYRKRKGLRKTNSQAGDLVLRLNMLKRSKKGHKMEDSWLDHAEFWKCQNMVAASCSA